MTGPALQVVSVDGAFVRTRGAGWWEVKTLAVGLVAAGAEGGSRATDLSYFSRLAEADRFADLATVELHRRGTATAGTVVGVADGAAWCQAFFDYHRPDAVRILDFAHAVGYLARAAEAAGGTGSDVGRTWLEEQAH